MKWISLHIGGQKWRVDLVKPNSKYLSGCDGITHLDKCRIYLDSSNERPALDDTLIHELLHASFSVSGAAHALQELGGGDQEKVSAAEETIVRCLTPIWHRILVDLGFKFPKGPAE